MLRIDSERARGLVRLVLPAPIFGLDLPHPSHANTRIDQGLRRIHNHLVHKGLRRACDYFAIDRREQFEYFGFN